jgi:hypothetical protein
MIRRAITDNALVFIACFSSQSLAKKKSYRAEKLRASREQLPPEVARSQQRAQAGMVHVWEERTSPDPRISQTQRAMQGRQPQGNITALRGDPGLAQRQ